MSATTWRDLADQLTPGQVQHLTRREELLRRGSRHRRDDADIDADLLGDARELTPAQAGDVAAAMGEAAAELARLSQEYPPFM
jgi:hypothetical protein